MSQLQRKPALHLVAISVSEYANASMNLKYAAKDGNDVIDLFKDKMKDPSSLDWDRKNAEFGMYKEKPVIAVPYRAKNGLGGMTLDKALCEVDTETREVKAALK